jgi:hypothetical protein
VEDWVLEVYERDNVSRLMVFVEEFSKSKYKCSV